jgi:hypothetical protein
MGNRFLQRAKIVVLQGFHVAHRNLALFHQTETRIGSADITHKCQIRHDFLASSQYWTEMPKPSRSAATLHPDIT